MRTKLLIYLSALLNLTCSAQYPGGVSANLRGWYNSNIGVTLTGGAVSQWSDQSGNGFNATQGTATSRPTQNTTGFNYNSTIAFDGLDNFLNVTDLVTGTTTGISAFAVARQTGTGNDTWGCVILGQANGPAWTGGGYGLTASNAGNTSFGFWVRDYAANVVSKATTLSVPSLMSGIWNGTTSNSVQYFQDALSQGTDSYSPGSVGDNGNTYIGTGYGSGTQYCFYGDIAEIAVYNTGLSLANTTKINSYLALKYGISLNSDYVNSAGATVYTPTAPYSLNILGIGRDDNTVLLQKQSHNYDDSVRIYISALAATNAANTGAFANSVSYVVMGANSGRLSGTLTEKPAGIYSRIQREWKVTNTGFTSTFNLSIKLNAVGVPGSVAPSDLRLLVDDDGDFSNATVYSSADGLTFSYANPLITVQGISTIMIASGATKYITIGTNNSATPLPIELLNFEAFTCASEVCLKWKTASEKNNSHFEIERSVTGYYWEKIKEVKGAGNSSAELSYSETDTHPLNGNSYYRIRQVDVDGNDSYSPVTTVDFSGQEISELKVYPNPSNEFVTLENPADVFFGFYLKNALGQDLDTKALLTKSDKSYMLNTRSLKEGIYYLQLIQPSANGITITKSVKFFVKHP